jgi:hypothetical protein
MPADTAAAAWAECTNIVESSIGIVDRCRAEDASAKAGDRLRKKKARGMSLGPFVVLTQRHRDTEILFQKRLCVSVPLCWDRKF